MKSHVNVKNLLKESRNSLFHALWFMLLTFPLIVIKVNTIKSTVKWRWPLLLYVGVITFILSLVWKFLLNRRGRKLDKEKSSDVSESKQTALRSLMGRTRIKKTTVILIVAFIASFPFLVSFYQVGIVTSALLFVILGLGLNVVIGYGGLLHLGYAAFYAAGAYGYALLYLYWNLPFWAALPLGALSGMVFGFLIGLPVIRLRGDYLAIVTLAFGEIVRVLLENMSGFTKGPEGIAQISRPAFLFKLSLRGSTIYLYFIVVVLVIITIFFIRRLEDSRIGRALEAMREDEIAAQSMGIDITKSKLITFVVSAFLAGLAGVILAGKTTYINPGSFTLMESVMILVAVVLGGTGSIPGVVLGALIVTLVPEYFRALSDYRMLMFGVALVVMSIFRSQGIIPRKRKQYRLSEQKQ